VATPTQHLSLKRFFNCFNFLLGILREMPQLEKYLNYKLSYQFPTAGRLCISSIAHAADKNAQPSILLQPLYFCKPIVLQHVISVTAAFSTFFTVRVHIL